MDMYTPKQSAYDALEASEHVDDSEFHQVYADNQAASAVLQGFARFMYHQKTGEPLISYSKMPASLTAFETGIFLQAFGWAEADLPETVAERWQEIAKLFEPRKKAAKSSK